MARKQKTQEEYLFQAKEKSPTIKVIGKYKGSLNRIDCRCLLCGYEWNPIANALLQGEHCPKCAGKNRRTSDTQFKNLLLSKNVINYEIISKFTTYQEKIKCKCNKCGHIWDAKPSNLISGEGCPKCAGHIKKTQKEFEKEVCDLVGNEYAVLGKYIEEKSKILFKHNVCDNIFSMTPSNFLQGQRCPICNQSKGEHKIQDYLNTFNLEYISQKVFYSLIGLGGGLLSYDFYLPTYNLLIEYQGEFHDGTAKLQSSKKLKRQQEHDRRKREYAKDYNIKLLEIWYWDYDNIDKILNYELRR